MNDPPEDCFGLVGTCLDGKYQVEQIVAEGGFGVVYRGTHRTLRKAVAIKVLKIPPDLRSGMRRQFLEKFSLEAQTIARLEHPAIVKILDFGAGPMPKGEAAPWMVLDWLKGTTLEDELEARRGAGGQSPAECLELLRPILAALATAHDEGVAHRDIKPGNLMIATSKRGERSLRLLDFGIAKVMQPDEAARTGQTATQTQFRAFSLHYAAPEQLSGTRTGPWTDVYAMALVFTEMLTDAPPYDGQDPSEIYADALSPRRPTPAKRGVDAGAWEPAIAKAVSMRPGDRYAGAAEFLAALEACIPSQIGRRPSHADPMAPTIPAGSLSRPVTTLVPAERPTSESSHGRSWPKWTAAAVLVVGIAVAASMGLRPGSPKHASSPPTHAAVHVPPVQPLPIAQTMEHPAVVSPVPIVAMVDAGLPVPARPVVRASSRRPDRPAHVAPSHTLTPEPRPQPAGRIHAE